MKLLFAQATNLAALACAALAAFGDMTTVETQRLGKITPPAPQDGRRMVWGDEFEGTALDQTKWRFRATMNSSDCVYTNDSRTARVENGCLHLLVVPSGNPAKPQMLSRGIATHDTMAFRYGLITLARACMTADSF